MTPQLIRRIRAFYRRTKPIRLLRPEDGLGKPLQIITLRHGKPVVERRRRYNASEVLQYTLDYDAAHVEDIEGPVLELEPGEVSRVYASTIPRSYLTAQGLFGHQFPIERHELFIELERQMPSWPGNLRMALRYWQMLNRIQYFSGKNYTQIEPFARALQRVRGAAVFLEEAAVREGAAVLVAHGLFNFFLALALRRRGWRRVKAPGVEYLGVAVYVK